MSMLSVYTGWSLYGFYSEIRLWLQKLKFLNLKIVRAAIVNDPSNVITVLFLINRDHWLPVD